MTTIRKATDRDVDAIHELIIEIAEYHNATAFVLTDKEEIKRASFGEDSKFDVLIAENQGVICGFVSYSLVYSIWLGKDYVAIDDLFVQEKFRGSGVGVLLMSTLQEICQQQSITKIKWQVETGNSAAIKFYKRLGAHYDIKGIFTWDF